MKLLFNPENFLIPIFTFLIQEVKQITTIEELESLMLKHGENIVDMISAEIDRIEKELKVMIRRVHKFHCLILNSFS